MAALRVLVFTGHAVLLTCSLALLIDLEVSVQQRLGEDVQVGGAGLPAGVIDQTITS